MVAFSGQLRKPGDFVVHNDTGQPILVVRGTDGVLRAFLNVCRHRSATVEPKPCGSNKRAFVCPYHGWSYDLTGRLVGITDGAGVRRCRQAASTACAGSRSRRSTAWSGSCRRRSKQGEDAGLDIDSYLGPLQVDLSGWNMQGWELHSSEPIRPRMNWKLVIDTFLELYHFRYLHPGTVYPLFLDNIATYERMGRHIRMAAAKRTLTELEGQPKEKWRILDHAIVLYQLFPNTVLTYTQDHCGVFTSFPVSPDEIGDALLGAGQSGGEGQEAGKLLEGQCRPVRHPPSSRISAIGETIQRNFRSGANRRQTFGKFEKALGWYHREIEARCAAFSPAACADVGALSDRSAGAAQEQKESGARAVRNSNRAGSRA